MKKIFLFCCCISLMLAACGPKGGVSQEGTKWHWENGTIVVDEPAMPAGQQTAVGLTADPIPVVHVGFVGLGMRGPAAVSRFTFIPGVEIVALCDYYDSLAVACQERLTSVGRPEAAVYSGAEGYKALCEREDIDLVYVATDWDHHFPVAQYALEHGKHVAIEVPSALNLEQVWTLVDLVEKTRKHCMILENCCYDFYELTALNMAQQGVFGDVVRCEGAYIHNLDPYWDQYWHNPDGSDPDSLHWRLKYNKEHRGDLYATHGLGPVAQVMNIHRGDRFTTLVAMDTRSVHGAALVEKKTGKPCTDFRSGDQTTTLMRTAKGNVVEIQHNVMTPQPYNRLYKIVGSKGYATKYPDPHFAIEAEAAEAAGFKDTEDLSGHEFMSDEQMAAFMAQYEHPLLKEYGEKAKEVGGHGGMDFIMDSRLVYCLQNGLPLDMDVYDLAEWCCLGELGEISMDNGCAAVAFPDFTRGHWADVQGYQHAYAPAAE